MNAICEVRSKQTNNGHRHLALGGVAANMLLGEREVIWGLAMVPLAESPNGILFRPTGLAGCTNVTDGQRDRPRYDNITSQ